jgi:hypothetical protein
MLKLFITISQKQKETAILKICVLLAIFTLHRLADHMLHKRGDSLREIDVEGACFLLAVSFCPPTRFFT